MEILHENNNEVAMEFKLGFQPNLQRISTVRIATILLDRPLVKHMIRDVFLRHLKAILECSPFVQIKDVDVQRIITKSLDQLDSCQLPSTLLNGVRIVTQSLVLKMFSWYDFVAQTLQLDEKKTISCIRKIYWTDYGTIDYKKTFELVWINNSQLTISDLLDMASNFCFVDYIKYHLNEYPQQQCELSLYWHKFFAGILKSNNRQHLHIAFRFMFKDELKYARKHCAMPYCRDNNDISENVNRFTVAAYRGICNAVKFRWSKLSDEERRMYLAPVTADLIEQHINWHREGYIETCVFLLNEMSHQDWVNLVEIMSDQSSSFIISSSFWPFEFLTTFFVVWPWNRFFVPILKKLWTFPALWCPPAGLPVTNLMKYIIDYHHKCSMTCTQWTMLLRHIWLAVPKHIKLLADFFSYKTLLIDLINNDQMQLVKLILHDVDLMEIKLSLTMDIVRECLLDEPSIFRSHQVEAFFNLASVSAEEREHLRYVSKSISKSKY